MCTVSVVYARQSASVSYSGGKVFLKKDDAWDGDSDLVRERPELFSEEPNKVAGRGNPRRAVERATRAPGEVRDVTPSVAAKKVPAAKSKPGSAGE